MPTLNLYWGDQPLSWLRSLTVTSFLKFNPEWKVKVWTGKAEAIPDWHTTEDIDRYIGHDWREELSVEWAECAYNGMTENLNADLCRWKVLSEGGIFADFDIIFMQPMDAYLEVLSKPSLTFGPHFALGICGGGEPFRVIHEHALKMATPQFYQSAGVHVLYDLALGVGNSIQGCNDETTWTRLVERVGHLERIPMGWVHPLDGVQVHKEPVPDTLGFHWYGGHPESKRLNELYTEPAALTPTPLARVIERVIY